MRAETLRDRNKSFELFRKSYRKNEARLGLAWPLRLSAAKRPAHALCRGTRPLTERARSTVPQCTNLTV